MGEVRLAAIGLACAACVLSTQPAAAQSRSPAGDKGGAKGLAGAVVQFEEKRSSAVIYLEESGGIVTQQAPRVERERVEPDPAPKSAATGAAKTAERVGNGASPLRASQSKPAPAPSAARP